MLARAAHLICLLFAAATAWAASPVEQRIQRIEQGLVPPVIVKGDPFIPATISQRMAALHVPGISIAVVHNGQIEWARGFGVARIGGPPVTTDTLFQAASISKPITALGVLRLVEQGKLNLDADVDTYLKSWKIPPTELTARNKVTLRRLLTHTGGMTVHGFAGYERGTPLPGTLQILRGVAPANSPAIHVDVEPGTLRRYSGGGYVIMQQLLVDVTGKPFDQFMAEQVLRPIGMTRSSFAQPLSDLTQAATAYTETGEAVSGGSNVYPEMAPAGLWTTPTELARYVIAIQHAMRGESGQVLSPAMAREMLTRQPGEPTVSGLGPQLGGSTSRKYFTHGGANAGFRCRFVGYTDGDGVVVMTNGDNGGALVDHIIRTVAREYGWPDLQPPERAVATVDPKAFAGYVGTYKLNAEETLTVTLEGHQLFSQISGQPRRALLPMAEREFFMKEMGERIVFTTDAQGRATRITQLHFGVEDVSPRVTD
jgi:CubicO group peptidase (beta-lactamase class C family)